MKTADDSTRNYWIRNMRIAAAHLFSRKLSGENNTCLCHVSGSIQKQARKKTYKKRVFFYFVDRSSRKMYVMKPT
jgi:hypothetical protein